MKPGKYTAKQLTDEAGFEDIKFGEDRIRIGGVRGIVKADQKINIQPESEDIEVMVGNETKTI